MGKRVFRLQFDERQKHFCRCGYCKMLGLISPFKKVKEDYLRSLEKLNYDLIDRVLVPCFAKQTDDYKNMIGLLSSKRIIHVQDQSGLNVIDDLSDLNHHMENLVILTKKLIKAGGLINKLKSFKGQVFFYSPRKTSLRDHFLSLKQIYKLTQKMQKQGVFIAPYPGLSLWEDRAPIDMCFEPAAFRDDEEGINKLISVIIPVFEQKKYLLRTLNALKEQSINKDKFEVIIVDDGGQDFLQKDIETYGDHLNIHYEYFPRAVKRKMGDFRFRAGIARNLGFRLSKGEILFFLDADVLLPENALATILREIDECDLLQIQRFDLTKEATLKEMSLENIKESDLIKKGREYWYSFFKEASYDWNKLSDCWKYVCTYGLIVKREDFTNHGGLYNNYIGYGFEDTDFGLRMKKSGAQFKLSDVKSYHQFHEHDRSEFKNKKSLRKKVLSRTAKTFYLNHLDPDIYRSLKDYM